MKKYVLVVRDRIITPKPLTDDTLIRLNCYYKSPEFLSEGTEKSLSAAIDKYSYEFLHFRDWTAHFEIVQ